MAAIFLSITRRKEEDNKLDVSVKTLERVVIDGYAFKVKAYFINHRLDKIRLLPVDLEMKDPGYPDRKYQEEKKKVADSFLRARLGEPLKESESVLYYEFDWGNVSSVAFLSGRNEHTGGFIEVELKQKGNKE